MPFGFALADLLADAPVRDLVLADQPAWLWDVGAARIVFANSGALTLMGAATLAELLARVPDDADVLARQLDRLAETLPEDGGARMAMLRLPGGGNAPTPCRCRRVGPAGHDLVLVVSIGVRGESRDLEPRLRALFEDLPVPVVALNGERRLFANAAGSAALARDEALRHFVLPTATGDVTLAVAPDAVAAGDVRTSEERQRAAADVVPAAPTTSAAMPREAPAAVGATETLRPRRFTFALDAEGHVTELGPALRAAVGSTGAVLGRRWEEIAAEHALDPDGHIARMIATRDTWSGVQVEWPREAGGRVAVRLAALPRFGENRRFLGYRGFGEILDASAATPESAPPAAEQVATLHRLHAVSAPDLLAEAGLSPRERSAFEAIAEALGGALPADADDDEADAETARDSEPVAGEVGESSEESAPRAASSASAGEGGAAGEETGERSAVEVGRGGIPTAERTMLELLARLPWGVGVVRDEELLYANRAFLETFGYTDLDDLEIAGGLAMLFEDRPRDFARAMATGRHRDGSRLRLEVWLSRAPWLDGPAILLSVRAVPEDAALEGEVRRLRTVARLASDGIVILDRSWRVSEVNPAARALLGDPDAPDEDLVGRPFLALVGDDDRPKAEAFLQRLAADTGATVESDVELVLEPQDRPLPVLAGGAAFAAANGRHYCLALRDLSRWKNVEAEALTARRRAELANEKKSDFLAKMSHEIRTPLNAIIGFAEVMLEERFGPLGNERYREYLTDVRESGEHIMSLLNDLLDLSKVEAGRLDLAFTEVRLNDIVEQTVGMMQPQANRQRVIIRTSLAARGPRVIADIRSLRQVLLNLLSNGIKFTPPGGQVIVSSVVTETGEVALRVRDTGVGMTEAETELALEPFRQVGGRAESSIKGSGLGLPLTKALAEANRARFAIRSQPEEGTLVEVVFPAGRVLTA